MKVVPEDVEVATDSLVFSQDHLILREFAVDFLPASGCLVHPIELSSPYIAFSVFSPGSCCCNTRLRFERAAPGPTEEASSCAIGYLPLSRFCNSPSDRLVSSDVFLGIVAKK